MQITTSSTKLPEDLPINSYGSTASKRVQRSAFEPLEKIPLVEIQRALDYVSKYGEPLPWMKILHTSISYPHQQLPRDRKGF